MADTTTLGGIFHVLVNDGFTWAQYEIEAVSEKAAHALARSLWSKRGEREKTADKPLPDGMAPDEAHHVGGHAVPEPEPEPEPEPAEVVEPEPEDVASAQAAADSLSRAQPANLEAQSASVSSSSASSSSTASDTGGGAGPGGIVSGGAQSEAAGATPAV